MSKGKNEQSRLTDGSQRVRNRRLEGVEDGGDVRVVSARGERESRGDPEEGDEEEDSDGRELRVLHDGSFGGDWKVVR